MIPWSGRCGFAIPATILMLIVFLLLGLVGLSLARQEVRSETRATARQQAFYAAEVGLAEGLQNWSSSAAYRPDTTWEVHQGTLPGGARYRVEVTLLGNQGLSPLYSMRAEGRARKGTLQGVGLLLTTVVLPNPMRSALEVQDSTHLAGEVKISGNDTIPSTWMGSYCSSTSGDVPGILMPDTTKLDREGGATYTGDPPKDEATDTTGFFDLGDLSFDKVAAMADITLPDGQIMNGSIPAPSYNADGSCNTGDPHNWGDPENPGQPCSSWFPLIYAQGDLRLEADQTGQGILLVEGDLSAKGNFRFYGPVFVKGELLNEGSFTFYGGVKAGNVDLGAGSAKILYADCVLERAFSHSSASRPRPLVDRPWFQNR